ncbi:S8 family peptidase [Spirosoma linguale]|uniref:Peptidase S8 and S53 subtilisin kexin sedolisin n=1 Tax=Spirosoma linguale (strain ATCC 33905 / DSM 74 / LMG 10896 / Claus 1) TaxID=504472 RepID=D2QQ23_SPILD|nr:peptidase S8 and S53 subtilisin kexin sedolisin [Spirosoma linguale DSM 74]
MRRFLSLATLTHVTLLGVGLFACHNDSSVAPTISPDCLVKASSNNGVAIAGEYIVTYQPTQTLPVAPNARVAATEALAESLLKTYNVANHQTAVLAAGEQTTFLAHLTESESQKLRQDPSVMVIEPDRIMAMCNCVDVAITSTLTWDVKQTGYGRGDLQTTKTAWIIDTGIDLDHPDLNVDTNRSRSFVSGQTSADDDNGHGTHVAGVIGAKNNNIGITGVASGATLVALRVLDDEGEGRLSGIIQAVNYVAQNGKAGDVVNLSLGGEGTSAALDRAITQAANLGILFAIASGNDGKNSDNYSPARVNHANVFTVSAMDSKNQFASFSNFGNSVDVCAYGVRITSTYKDGKYATLSGTSMAAPHVAGLLLIRGSKLPTHGTVTGDPDGKPDPMAGE